MHDNIRAELDDLNAEIERKRIELVIWWGSNPIMPQIKELRRKRDQLAAKMMHIHVGGNVLPFSPRPAA